MIQELDVVALQRDIPGTQLRKGDMGTIVLVHGENEAYMVEFLVQTGFTADLEEIKASDVRPLEKGEINQRKYREWKPEWTGSWGYIPPVSELPEWERFADGRCPDAHYLAYVDGHTE